MRGYCEQLASELGAVGIRGRLRSRIVAEFADHLLCDPEAQLGDPGELARQFADELGTARTRRVGLTAFSALAVAGVLFGLAFVTSPGPAFGAVPPGTPWPGRLANAIGVLAPQLAFVAGLLAWIRCLRRRASTVIPAAEAHIIRRRATVGVLAGALSMTSLGTIAFELRHHLPAWWVTLAEAGAGVGLAALLPTLPLMVQAFRLRPVGLGGAGDVFDDLGAWLPASLRGRPWRFALLVAAALAVTMTVLGVLAADGFDGALRGVFEALACLLGFATLGRYLGLWAPRSSGELASKG